MGTDIGRRMLDEINNRYHSLFEIAVREACEMAASLAGGREMIVERPQTGPLSATVCFREKDGTHQPAVRVNSSMQNGMLTTTLQPCVGEASRAIPPNVTVEER